MNPDTIAELRRLLAAATPGPWLAEEPRTIPDDIEQCLWGAVLSDPPKPLLGDSVIGVDALMTPEDAALIVALRNHAEALLAAAELASADRTRRALALLAATDRLDAEARGVGIHIDVDNATGWGGYIASDGGTVAKIERDERATTLRELLLALAEVKP